MRDNKQENDNREAVSDVLAEMRGMGNYQHYSGDHAHALADRIEAAWKRERAKVEADALAVGGIVEAARTAEKSSAVGNSGPKFDLCRDVDSVLRIGREFQKQDRWRGAHHDTAKLLCDTIEYLRDSFNTQVGNAAAMREALLNIQEYAAAMDVDDGNVLAILDSCRDALSAPARNCDFYDNKTAAETAFVEETGADEGTPHYWQMFANWLFWKNDRKGEVDDA